MGEWYRTQRTILAGALIAAGAAVLFTTPVALASVSHLGGWTDATDRAEVSGGGYLGLSGWEVHVRPPGPRVGGPP